MKILYFLALLLSTNARAAVFDAADFLAPHSVTIGGFGELLLSDPSSEGLEGRLRYGLNEDWNIAAILGGGSKNKQTRIGGEAVYNFIPDFEGQIGISSLIGFQYQKRNGGGGVYMRWAPMVHKKVSAWNGLPSTIYLALPISVDARNSVYQLGTQLALGSITDLSDRFYLGAEAGIRFSKSESYILLGAGFRFGEVRLAKGEKKKENKEEDEEYRSEDFSTPARKAK